MENQRAGIKLGPPVEGWNRLPENMALVRIIRQQRQRLGLSLNQLAERTKNGKDRPQVSRQMLGFFEADKYLPGLDVLGHIARALGTTSAHLLFEAERWIAGLPACCHACKYACMAEGSLKWLDAHRQCTRPQTALPASPAILPVSR
jgi:transcriptional regulator with XRE-family HTH domain